LLPLHPERRQLALRFRPATSFVQFLLRRRIQNRSAALAFDLRRDHQAMSDQDVRIRELIDQIQALLDELREAVRARPSAEPEQILEAFADEALRDRDA
jgi:hypothetical protein